MVRLTMIILSLWTPIVQASSEEKAIRKAAEAAYIQTGLKKDIEDFQEKLLENYVYEYIDKEIIDVAAWGYRLGEAYHNKKIWLEYEWKFQ